jgi:hypothetical protein
MWLFSFLQPSHPDSFSENRQTCFSGAIIPLIKKHLMYNKKYPLSEKLLQIDEEDPGLVDSAYDNLIAPVIEETIFALIPSLLFPDSLFAFICFRGCFLLLHIIEKDNLGKLKLKSISLSKLFIPTLVSVFAIISRRFDVALVSHIIMNALITPVINKYSGLNLLKAALPVLRGKIAINAHEQKTKNIFLRRK